MLRCPVCSTSNASPLITLTQMPLIGCLFAHSLADALAAERGTLDLVQCHECTHIYNRAFEPERVRYVPGYENALGFSGHHRAQRTARVDQLIHNHRLKKKFVAEIGCGDAEFLSQLCNRGNNLGIGYDPSQRSRTFQTGGGAVEVRSEDFTAQNRNPVDFICALHVLEHLHELGDTLRHARKILKSAGAGFFEVPNGRTIFAERHVWDLTYEHFSYFTPLSLQRALLDAGFSVSKIDSGFGGQYLYAEVMADNASAPPSTEEDLDAYRTFPEAFASILAQWDGRISSLAADGRRTVLWGAGTKAVSFLNMLHISVDHPIKYIVDINPRKSGRFVPGTAQQIVPPEHLRIYRPDVVVAMNAEYVSEIQATLDSMSLECQLLVGTGGPNH